MSIPLVLVTAYFAAAWLGRGVRKDVLGAHIERMHQRFNDVPEFFHYGLTASALLRPLSSMCRSARTPALCRRRDDGQPDLPGCDELAFIGEG